MQTVGRRVTSSELSGQREGVFSLVFEHAQQSRALFCVRWLSFEHLVKLSAYSKRNEATKRANSTDGTEQEEPSGAAKQNNT